LKLLPGRDGSVEYVVPTLACIRWQWERHVWWSLYV